MACIGNAARADADRVVATRDFRFAEYLPLHRAGSQLSELQEIRRPRRDSQHRTRRRAGAQLSWKALSLRPSPCHDAKIEQLILAQTPFIAAPFPQRALLTSRRLIAPPATPDTKKMPRRPSFWTPFLIRKLDDGKHPDQWIVSLPGNSTRHPAPETYGLPFGARHALHGNE